MSRLDDIAGLLSASSNSPDREMAIVFLAEARIMFRREQERMRELQMLLDAREAEYVRTGANQQLALAPKGAAR